MRLPALLRRKGETGAEIDRLKGQVARLEADLAFLRSKHEALLAEGNGPRHENAVLRYDLQKCQRDRQVLEWHLNATRGELRMALALVRRYDGSPDVGGRALLQQAVLLVHEARLVGIDGDAVDALESSVRERWGERSPEVPLRLGREAVALRLGHLFADLEAGGTPEGGPMRSDAEFSGLPDEREQAFRVALRGVLEKVLEGLPGVGDARSG